MRAGQFGAAGLAATAAAANLAPGVMEMSRIDGVDGDVFCTGGTECDACCNDILNGCDCSGMDCSGMDCSGGCFC